jgi:pilus assembly protein CpaC
MNRARLLLVGIIPLLLGAAIVAAQPPATEPWASVTPTVNMTLKPGEVASLRVDEVTKFAVGNEEVVDFEIMSASEVLLEGKATGRTNIIVWDNSGRWVVGVEVTDVALEGAEEQITQLLRDLHLTQVEVKRKGDKLFLVGEVSQAQDMERLQQLVDTFEGRVLNLVRLAVAAPAPLAVLPQLVRLSVQVIEMNRKDVEQLGVSWNNNENNLSFTEPATTDNTLSNALFRWGTSVNRSAVAAEIKALVQKNRARVLAEPRLVTASGKEASSFIGVEVPIQTATAETESGTASSNIEFRQTGVLLTMTPTVHSGAQHRKITTSMRAEISGIDSASTITVNNVPVPGFRVRRLNTEVTTESGETVVIAGLLESEDSNTLNQIPALGSIPGLGRLFRSPSTSSIQNEILIAVTPELLVEEDISTDRLVALEQALGNPIEQPSDKALFDYATHVQQQLSQGMGYPDSQRAPGTSGRVKVRLHLGRDGRLLDAEVLEPSGIDVFDAEALDAAKRQAPYTPIPESLGRDELWLDVPIIFNPFALEQAVGEAFKTAASAASADTPQRRYALRVQDHLAQGIQYPEHEKQIGASGQTLLRLHVMRTGSLADAVVAQSSGLPALDRAALEAAVRQAPYPPFPSELRQQELWLDMPVLFQP